MMIYRVWEPSAGGLVVPTPLDELSDERLNEVVSAGSRCSCCGGAHPETAAQASIILLARSHGWPTQPVTA